MINMNVSAGQYFTERPPILAGPMPILNFVGNATIKEFALKGQKITTAAEATVVKEMASEKAAKALAVEDAPMMILPKDFPGGIRLAHVHYQGDIYLLKKEDWKAFSGKIIEDFRAKLATAKNINYDQLMKLSDAMQDII